jgi:F0F1-type ATP synthase beta subunit
LEEIKIIFIKKFMSGFVTQIIGPVIDVEFPEGVPAIYNALKVTKETSKKSLLKYNT